MNYPANSHRSRDKAAEGASAPAEPKKVERVTTSDVVQRKKPLGRRIAETFTGEDAGSVVSYVVVEVMVPALKTTLSDMVSQGIERLLFGDSRPRGGSSYRSGYTNYNSISRGGPKREEPRQLSRTARARHDFDEVILKSRGEAEEVLDRLQALVDQYDVATVSDLYDLVGVTGSFTDDKWGWSDLRSAGVRRVKDGFLLELPPTTPVN